MRPSALALTIGLCCVLAVSAGAVRAQTFSEKIGGMITDDLANQSIRFALENVHKAICPNDQPCPPASDEELAAPPIGTQDSRVAMITGVRSALASWCGLDFQRSFQPMMRQARRHQEFGDRELALLSIIHGAVMGRQVEKFGDKGQVCPDKLRAQLDAQLPRVDQ